MVKKRNKLIAFFAALSMCLIMLAALMGGGLTAYGTCDGRGQFFVKRYR